MSASVEMPVSKYAEDSAHPIYLDYSATTPVDPRVAAKMIPYLTEDFGNPASRSHPYGWTAEKAVENAREEVARLVGADPVSYTHLDVYKRQELNWKKKK